MAKSSVGENINHIGAIRLRVTGVGNLHLTLYSLDNVETQSLVDLTLSLTNAREPTRLSNFKQQRTYLKLSTTNINDQVEVNKILIFIKAIATDFPS